MERIKQALARARKERESNGAAISAESGKQLRSSAAPDVIYTTTRVVPVNPAVLQRNHLIAGSNDADVITAYNMLRTQVLQRLQEHGWNSVAVVSANPGEGKTLTAINLAISMAREVDKTVLLVDLNLRAPSIAAAFGYQPEHGVADYLLHDVPLSSLLFNPGIERLVVLPGVGSVANSAELLASAKMVQMVEELKVRYPERVVIFDLPALLGAADALAFAPYVESALLVVEDGMTARIDVTDALHLLKATSVLGTVLNRQMVTARSRQVSRR